MDREEMKKMLPIIQAYVDGKVVEYQDAETGEWKVVDDYVFLITVDDKPCYYRIKSEPKYRPFKDAEECWNEMLKHEPFGWVKDKEDEHIFIVHLIDTGVCGGDDLEGFTYGSAIKVYQFTDGTPFGIKEGGEE